MRISILTVILEFIIQSYYKQCMTAFKSFNCCSCEPGRKVNIAREIIKDSYYNGKFDYLNFHYADDENKWITTVSLLFCDAIFLSFGNIN